MRPSASAIRSTLLSDEPYNRIVFDGRTFHSPAEVYPHTIVTYSYGKTLLAPGMRIGYIAVPPTMPGREDAARAQFLLAQIATGYSFPNALLQHAIEDLERLSIDIPRLERRRDRMVGALPGWATSRRRPEGTFYIMASAPIDDDVGLRGPAGRRELVVLPGTVVEVPGWFRVSLTASDAMVEASLAGFERARARALDGAGVPA